MGLAEVVVDFCACQYTSAVDWASGPVPCSVRVMDCSSFSNSSVSVKGRWTMDEGRDMITSTGSDQSTVV